MPSREPYKQNQEKNTSNEYKFCITIGEKITTELKIS
jgi:hypothetical protein